MQYTLTKTEFDSIVEKTINEYKEKQHAYIDEWAIPKTFEELTNLLWVKLMKDGSCSLRSIGDSLSSFIGKIKECSKLDEYYRGVYISFKSFSDDELILFKNSMNVITRVENYFKSTEYFFDELTTLSNAFLINIVFSGSTGILSFLKENLNFRIYRK